MAVAMALAPTDERSGAGAAAAALIDTASASHGSSQASIAKGRANGIAAARAAPPIPAYISAETRGPAAALDSGENGLKAPKVQIDSGAVAASAARPAATGAQTGGGSQRLATNS